MSDPDKAVPEASGANSPMHPSAKSFIFTGGAPISFKDMVMEGGSRRAASSRSSFSSSQQAKVSFIDGDRLRPSICFSEEAMQKLSEPWEDGLILSVLGLKGMVSSLLNSIEDRSMVINGGPWMVFDRYLVVSPWTRDFSPATYKIMKTMVWVRLPALGLVYYEEEALRIIASTIGKPIKIDSNTLIANRGKYARICVEIDLGLPVVSSILINGEWQRVEYEGLHLICTKCGRYGHIQKDCSEIATEEQTKGDSDGDINGDMQSMSIQPEFEPATNEESVVKLDNCDTVPPQPPLGDWVVVQNRRKKKSLPQSNMSKQTEQKKGQSTHLEQHPFPVSGTSTTKPMRQNGPRRTHCVDGSSVRGSLEPHLSLNSSFSPMVDTEDRQGLKRYRPIDSFGSGSCQGVDKEGNTDIEKLPPPAPPDSEMLGSED